MHDDVTKLWMLLQIHRELVGHPRLKALRGQVETELAKYNLTPAEVEAAAPVYPIGSGPVETDTAAVVEPSQRRA